MNLDALDMPDDPTQLASWLEGRLAGPDLDELADELSAFRAPPSGPAPAVRDLLGEWQEPVLAGGLKLAPPEVLRRLLAWPERLLDLQELVFARGGRYWDGLLAGPADLSRAVQHSRQRLSAALPSAGPARTAEAAPAVLAFRQPTRRRFGWAVGVAAAAAAAVATVGVTRVFFPPPPAPTPTSAPPPPEVAWGWNRPAALDQSGAASEYLKRLADAGNEWFDERPEDPAALAKRLNELYEGCGKVAIAEHRPLSDDDKKWLTDKCRQWAVKMDRARAEVEAGQAKQGRDDADDTVTRLVAALRKKAEERGA